MQHFDTTVSIPPMVQCKSFGNPSDKELTDIDCSCPVEHAQHDHKPYKPEVGSAFIASN